MSQDPPGKLMALDVGEARIGVASCDPLGYSVRPLVVIKRRSRREDFDQLAEIIRSEEVEAIICGLPLNIDGTEGSQAQTTRKWAMRLARVLHKILDKAPPVIFWDERLSSYAADELLAAEDSIYNLKAGQDAVAAAVILQSYLDARRRRAAEDYGRIDLSS
jgi:putative holliday junction resolvase